MFRVLWFNIDCSLTALGPVSGQRKTIGGHFNFCCNEINNKKGINIYIIIEGKRAGEIEL